MFNFSLRNDKNLELMLPVEFIQTPDDYDAGLIGIRVHGNILGNEKAYEVFYCLKKQKMYSNGDYEQIINLLKDNQKRMVKVLFEVKGSEVNKIKIDLHSLALNYNDSRLANLELVSYSLYDIPNKNNHIDDKSVLADEKRAKTRDNAFLWTIGIMELILNLLFLFTKPYWLFVIFPITTIFVYSLYAMLKINK